MTRQAFPVSNGYAPQGGPRGLPISLDFTGQASYAIDLVQEVEANIINMVQAIYVDNSANANALTIIFDQTNQRIVVPATAQGIWPVITPKEAPRFVASTTQAAVVVNLLLLNVPMPLTQWGPLAVTVNNVNATFTPTVSNATDKSGFIAAGGVSQQLAAANAARKRIVIENPSNAVNGESLFINFGAAASLNAAATPDSFEILPGGYYDSGFGPVSGQQINVNAATINHQYIAKEW